jgi:hypothetical protein
MVIRSVVRVAVMIVAVGYVMPAFAGEIGDFLSSIARDTKRRHGWPEPFIYQDRDSLRQHFALQVAAGWERQNMLSEFHFLAGGKELTEAGRVRLQSIINEAPEPHRQIFVHRADTPQETGMRMQTVQRFVAQSPYANDIPILESTRTDEGWPADRIDIVSKKLTSAVPDPRLGGGAAH